MTDNFVAQDCCQERRTADEKLFDVKFQNLKEIYEGKIEAAVKATALAIQSVGYVTKDDYNKQILNLEGVRIDAATLKGKAEQKDVDKLDTRSNSTLIVSIIGLALSLISVIVVIVHMVATGK
jgi:hypothetical protein